MGVQIGSMVETGLLLLPILLVTLAEMRLEANQSIGLGMITRH